MGAAARRSRRPRHLRCGRFKDALQTDAHRQARCRSTAALRPSRDRQLSSAHRAHLHGLQLGYEAPELTEEVAIVFNTLTGLAGYPGLKKLMVAPFDLSERLINLIERERDHARAGKPARIIAKLNSLVDDDIIEKLYEASCAGVKIDLIVRGICCLRPRVPGLSENIRVISIVGRFLEHSRVYYFENAGQAEIYLSSADWMPRNFYRRVEIAFPIDAPALREEMASDILPSLLNDQVKARELRPDGSYARLHPAEGAARSQAQLHFRERSRQARKAAAELQAASGVKLIPIKAKRDQRKRA